jgi:hypothetical protein
MLTFKNHSIIMVMCIYQRIAMENLNRNSEDYKMISDIRDAVDLLSNSKFKDDGNYFYHPKSLIFKNDQIIFLFTETSDLQLRNQNGVLIEMSKEDQKCLTMAMVLHQKGKSLVKSKEYLKALILLAEADNEFKYDKLKLIIWFLFYVLYSRNCNDRALLERVDNYALLNLDIVWCYLCLENLHDLKNAG